MNIQEINTLIEQHQFDRVIHHLGSRALETLSDDEYLALLHCYAGTDQLEQAQRMIASPPPQLAQRGPFLSLVASLKLRSGEATGAIEILQQLRERDPHDPDIDFNLGLAHEHAGQQAEATHYYQQTLLKNPYHGEAYINLGNFCFDQGDLAGAAEYFQFAYLRTGIPESAINYAVILVNEGRVGEAKKVVEQALKRFPQHETLRTLYLKLLIGVDQLELSEAETELAKWTQQEKLDKRLQVEEAVRNRQAPTKLIAQLIEPEQDARFRAKLCYAAGEIALKEQANLEMATLYYQQGVDFSPKEASNYAGLALTNLWRFDFDAMAGSYQLGWEQTHSQQLLENFIFNMHNHPQESIEQVVSLCQRYADHFLRPFSRKFPSQPRSWSAKAVLRIGFLSEGFNGHPVGYMGLPVIQELFQRGYETYLYSSTSTFDAVNAQFKSHATQYLDIRPMSDEALIEQMRADQLDLYFDLTGHSNGTRLSVAAARVAPLQIKWVGGIISSTHCPNMDLFIGDRWETPQELHQYYSEEVLMMPNCYMTFRPQSEVPDPVVRSAQPIVFGSFNRLDKLSPELVESWSTLLKRVDGSRLMIKGKNASDPSVCQRVIDLFAQYGVTGSQLEFRGGTSQYAHLQAYNDIDIHLDTIPYSGCLTTLEALLMGVPVVTLAGKLFSSRHGISILTNAGFPQWVTHSSEAYIDKVVEITEEIDLWRWRRSEIRQTLLSSPLSDAGKFTDHLLEALIERLETLPAS